MTYLNDILFKESKRPDLLLARSLLSAGASAYRAGLGIRNGLYRSGIRKATRLDVPVISIGNLTVGGTGKTPLVAYIASCLKQEGKKAVIISRGYKGRSRGTLTVSDEKTVLAGPGRAGDEPVLLARKLPGTPVLVNKDRAAAARTACDRFNPDIIILDDAYQHLAVARAADILVIDAANPFGNGHLLPRGTLREPRSAISRADLIIITKANQAGDLTGLQAVIKRYSGSTPVLLADYMPGPVTDLKGQAETEVSALAKRQAFLVSGIAQPGSFKKTAEELRIPICGEIAFSDHHPFTPFDLEDITRSVVEKKADYILTTEKDAVRFPVPEGYRFPLYSLGLDIRLKNGPEELLSILRGKLTGTR